MFGWNENKVEPFDVVIFLRLFLKLSSLVDWI